MRHEDMTEGDPRLEALFDALGEPDPIDAAVAARHVAAAAAEAASAPIGTAGSGSTSWYRRVLVRGASLGLTAKLFLGTAIAVAATGGAAAGGILPNPVQSFVAETASYVGIDLPNPDTSTTSTSSSTTTTSTTIASPSVATAIVDDATVFIDVTPGSYRWETATCGDSPIVVTYTVTSDGALVLASVSGTPDDVAGEADRIRVRYPGVRIDIRLDDDELTVDEDRDCAVDDDSTTTTTDDDSTTTTTDDDEPDDDSTTTTTDDDEPDDDSTTTTAADHPAAGSHTWTSTSCDGASIAASYRVTAEGDLVLTATTGDVTGIDEAADRIRVEFGAVEVDIRIDGSALRVTEDRDCTDDD